MRRRMIKGTGRLFAFMMAFFTAFSGTSACFPNTAEAAVSAADTDTGELKGMLSVGTVVKDDLKNDSTLKELLTKRDLLASGYAGDKRLSGISSSSGSLGRYGSSDMSAEWFSNVLYQGDILRSDSFDGFLTLYNGGANAAVIESGINEIDVQMIPLSDLEVSEKGRETDIKTWNTSSGFAYRFIQPQGRAGKKLELKSRNAVHTKLFVVGIQGGMLSKGIMYEKDHILDFPGYLSCIGGAEPNSANLASYLDYIRTFYAITGTGNGYLNSSAGQITGSGDQSSSGSSHRSGSSSDDDDDDDDDDPEEPGTDPKGRTIMIYLDGADLMESAVLNLYTMLVESAKGSIGEDNHIIILTGGSKEAWKRNDGKSLDDFLYDTNGVQQKGLAASIGTTNQLWELRDGRLTLLQDGFNDNGYMTQGANLAAFIKAVKDRYPDSSMYDLIMWDHGGGPEGGFGLDTRLQDSNAMSLVDMTNAIKDSGIKFDFILFDACLMSNAEVALALSPHTSYLVLSEQIFPGKGLNTGYINVISGLVKDNNVDTKKYSQNIIQATIDTYETVDGEDAILALIDSEKVRGGLAEALETFSSALMGVLKRNDHATLETILKIRKAYTYPEVRANDADTNDLIDVQGFCEALMDNYGGELKTKDPVLYAACEKLRKAAQESILYKQVSVNDERKSGSRDLAVGTEPQGISMYFPTFQKTVVPIGKTDGSTDQILNLISAYSSSESLDSYGKAIAAYGLWLKAGKILGYDTFWNDDAGKDEDAVKRGLYDSKGGWSVQELQDASGLTEEEINRILESQIRNRIRKEKISVQDIYDDEDVLIQKALKVSQIDPDLVDRVEIQMYICEKDSQGNIVKTKDGKDVWISMGRSNMYATDVEKERGADGRGTASATINKFDNKWLVLDGRVVSYYDTEIRSIDGVDYRMGVIPVAYWQQKRVGDETDSTLKAAIENNKVQVGVLEVRFRLGSDNNYESTGTIWDFRRVNDASLAMSGYTIAKNEIYELLAGFDNGKNADSLRSIGVIQSNGSNMQTVQFATVNALDIGYNIVDAYETRYSLEEAYFAKNDPRNLDDFYYELTAEEKETAVAVPFASQNTADQSGLDGSYSDRTVKSAGNTSPAVKTEPRAKVTGDNIGITAGAATVTDTAAKAAADTAAVPAKDSKPAAVSTAAAESKPAEEGKPAAGSTATAASGSEAASGDTAGSDAPADSNAEADSNAASDSNAAAAGSDTAAADSDATADSDAAAAESDEAAGSGTAAADNNTPADNDTPAGSDAASASDAAAAESDAAGSGTVAADNNTPADNVTPAGSDAASDSNAAAGSDAPAADSDAASGSAADAAAGSDAPAEGSVSAGSGESQPSSEGDGADSEDHEDAALPEEDSDPADNDGSDGAGSDDACSENENGEDDGDDSSEDDGSGDDDSDDDGDDDSEDDDENED